MKNRHKPMNAGEYIADILGVNQRTIDCLFEKIGNANANGLESPLLELKATYHPSPKCKDGCTPAEHEWNVMKAFVAMANAQGGCVVIGLKENEDHSISEGDIDPDLVLNENEDKDLINHINGIFFSSKAKRVGRTYEYETKDPKRPGKSPTYHKYEIKAEYIQQLSELVTFHRIKCEKHRCFVIAAIVKPVAKEANLLLVNNVLYHRDDSTAQTRSIDDFNKIAKYKDNRKLIDFSNRTRRNSPFMGILLTLLCAMLFASIWTSRQTFHSKLISASHINAEPVNLEREFTELETNDALRLLRGATSETKTANALAVLKRAAMNGSLRANFAYGLHLIGSNTVFSTSANPHHTVGPDVNAGLVLLRNVAGSTPVTNSTVLAAQKFLAYCLEYGFYGIAENPIEALQWRERAATAGDSQCQAEMAEAYLLGNVVAPDLAKGFALAQKSADKNNTHGMIVLGGCHMEGLGTPTNHFLASEWFKKAAQQGNPEAQHCLAICYRNGYGVDIDDAKADQLLRSAAENGCSEAQWNWGIRQLQLTYQHHQNASTDAMRWITMAASNHIAQARQFLSALTDVDNFSEGSRSTLLSQAWIGSRFNNSSCVQTIHDAVRTEKLKFDPKVLQHYADKFHPMAEFLLGENLAHTDTHAATEWYKRASQHGNSSALQKLADLVSSTNLMGLSTQEYIKVCTDAAMEGNANAQYNLGILHLANRNDQCAASWFREAAKHGHARAQYNLAILLACNTNQIESIMWLQCAASNGLAAAVRVIGIGHEHGLWNLRKDLDCAIHHYQSAASNGDSLAMGYLGLHYLNGNGLAQDKQKGFELIRLAAEQVDNEEIQVALGLSYYTGDGTHQDYARAAHWFHRAADSGNKTALRQLAHMYHKGLGVEKNDNESRRLIQLYHEK